MPVATKTPYAAAIYANGELDGPQIGTLVVVVDKGRNLPNRRTMGKQDPYFNARLGKEAKKTNADKRGGQTPKWDQELRFTVHDSPDYYTMKVSLFDEGKRTELIGDAWVDLKGVIVPGGGEAEIWQELKCKGKYAGEVRLEFTYYDSRPKIEKPTPKKQPSKVSDDGTSPAGSARGRTPVKRRPLPTNPSSIEQPRSFAAGPRDLGTPKVARSIEATPSHSRSSRSNTFPHVQQTPAPYQQHESVYHHDEDFDPFVNEYEHQEQDDFQRDFSSDYAVSHIENDWPHRHSSGGSQHVDRQHEGHHPADFLPRLPPMSGARDSGSGRISRSQQHNAASHDFGHGRQSSPAVSTLQQCSSSYQNWQPDVDGSPLDETNDFANNHSRDQFIDPRLVMHDPYEHGAYSRHSLHEEFPDSSVHMTEDDVPPPPPMHKASHSNEVLQIRHSSAAIDAHEQSWTPQRSAHDYRFSVSPDDAMFGSPVETRSRSELGLTRHRASFDNRSDIGVASSPFESHRSRHDLSVRSHRSLTEEPAQLYGLDTASPQSPYYHSTQSSPIRQEMPHTPRSTGSFSYDNHTYSPTERRNSYQAGTVLEAQSRSLARYSQHTSTYPPVQASSLGSSPRYAHSRNGSVSQSQVNSPTKPHPLSQQQDLMSSSPLGYEEDRSAFRSSYDPNMPLIKPLAIAPKRSQPSTPTSMERTTRNQSRSTVPRKSISPHPASANGNTRFSAFSPDSFDAFNPRNDDTRQHVNAAEPIVDFHGNVIDPSDRLPETSWAPEPTKPVAKVSDDHLPPSTWAPEPERAQHRNSEPRRITVRTRDIPRGTRAGHSASNSPSHTTASYNIRSSPDNRTSMHITSPQSVGSPVGSPPSTTPHTRNRLKKLNRPHSMVAMSSSSPAQASAYGWTPPRPAKIPLDDNRSMVPYHGGQGMDRLNFELQNISIGGEPRRIAGRRLLEYGA